MLNCFDFLIARWVGTLQCLHIHPSLLPPFCSRMLS
jgi:folate-dependent phosphoribosylglycinamide formyltransferase PurN